MPFQSLFAYQLRAAALRHLPLVLLLLCGVGLWGNLKFDRAHGAVEAAFSGQLEQLGQFISRDLRLDDRSRKQHMDGDEPDDALVTAGALLSQDLYRFSIVCVSLDFVCQRPKHSPIAPRAPPVA